MRSLLSFLLVSALVGCSDPGENATPIYSQPDVGAFNDAGDDASGDASCTPETDAEFCVRLGTECGGLSGQDNCGTDRTVESCGDEATVCDGVGETCGGAGIDGQCGCTGETDAELCTAATRECGSFAVTDKCGVERTANCGDATTVCEAMEQCDETGTCVCVPESDTEMCTRLDVECGELIGMDNCGVTRTIASCGDAATVCAQNEVCGGAGTPGQCGCAPQTDAELCAANNYECGDLTATDNCGTERMLNCGTDADACPAFQTCGGAGTAGECGCTPETDEAMCTRLNWECGELVANDNCGAPRTIATCGDPMIVCGEFETCGGGGTAGTCGCTPETDLQLCQVNGYACGSLTATDKCGVERTVADCGTSCLDPQSCGGGGVPGQCGCTADDDATLCSDAGFNCGVVSIKDNCDATRPIDCGAEDLVCTLYDTCGGGGQANVCGCTPTTCAADGILCGAYDDGCGGTLACDSFCVDDLKAGASHVCAVGSGRVKCWGKNDKGQLGNGNTTQQNNPVNVQISQSITAIAPGGSHTCALTATGAVYCWGLNQNGQLGVGTTVDNKLPGSPAIISGATAVVSGENHVCALVNGGVKCWGHNEYGKIGNSALNLGVNAAIAIAVDGLGSNVVEISAGQHHTCALKNDGTVWCWGRNQYGQCGNLQLDPLLPIEAYGFNNTNSLDVNTQVNSPVQVANIANAKHITVGRDVSCAIDDQTNVYCWGAMTRPSTTTTLCPVDTGILDNNGNPVLKNGTVCSLLPTTNIVTYPITKYSLVTKVSTTACASDAECGPDQYCNAALKCATDTYPISTVFVDRAALTPQPMGISNAEQFSAGANHLCAVVTQPDTNQTNVLCMGLNTYGQLGDGTNNNWTVPVPVYYDINDNIVRAQTVTGSDNSTCALIEDANVQCWGSNQFGQIGNTALVRDESYRPFDVKLDNQP